MSPPASSKLNAAKQDAIEFGVLQKQGSARQALLCARAVGSTADGKLSAKAFATESKFRSPGRIVKYVQSWDEFAKANDLPTSDQLVPGQEVEFDNDDLDESKQWDNFAPTSDASADYRVGGTEVADKYREVAEQLGISPGMAIRAGANKNGMKAALLADTAVQKFFVDLIKENPEIEKLANKAISEKWHDIHDPAPIDSGSMTDWVKMTTKFGAVKHILQDILGLALNIEGFAEQHGQRDAALARVAEVRNVLDAIEGVAKGQSMDAGLAQLLDEGAL